MIENFLHRGLKELFETGRTKRIAPEMVKPLRLRLDALHAAANIAQLNQPGWRLHYIAQDDCYSIDVRGPWRLRFKWRPGVASQVDFVQPH